MHTVHNLQGVLWKRVRFLVKKRLLFSYQRHSNSIILILSREKVRVFKLKSNAQMVADGYKGLRDKQRTG